MLLSKLIEDDVAEHYINEKEFATLGILDSNTHLNFLTFIDDEKFLNKLKSKNNISMILTTLKLSSSIPANVGVYICENPRILFFELNNLLANNKEYIIGKFETKIGHACSISKLSCISNHNVIIGNNVLIEEFVSIKEGVEIGDNSIIRAGSVLGSSGFEFKRNEERIIAVNHYGGVKIGQYVEIKCNTVIDKAIYPWDSTVIGDYSKLDNLIHIGHACKIGKRVMIPANSVIGGRVEIDDDAWIGIGSSIRNGIHIGKNARCNMGSVVTKNVEDNEAVTGNFAIKHRKFIENLKKQN